MKKGFVAVLLLNWNRSNLTLQCIESIRKSNYERINIYLLDQNSKPEDYRKLKNVKKINLYRAKRNLGFAEGNNFLIRKALQNKENSYFLVLNNDTTQDKNCISKLVSSLEEEDVGAAQPKIIYGYNKNLIQEGGAKRFNFISFSKKDYYRTSVKSFPKKKFYTDMLCGCCMMIKREVFINLCQWFRKDYFVYYEDTEFSLRMREAGYKLSIEPSATIVHWESSSSSKIGGLALYYLIRNGIAMRYDRGNFLEKVLYFSFLFCLKIPKNLISISIEGKKGMLKVYRNAILDGLFYRLGERKERYSFVQSS